LPRWCSGFNFMPGKWWSGRRVDVSFAAIRPALTLLTAPLNVASGGAEGALPPSDVPGPMHNALPPTAIRLTAAIGNRHQRPPFPIAEWPPESHCSDVADSLIRAPVLVAMVRTGLGSSFDVRAKNQ